MKFVSRFLTERLLDIFKHCCQNISSKALWKSVSDNVPGRSKIQMTTKLNPNYTTISGWTPDTERLSCSALLQGLRYTGGKFQHFYCRLSKSMSKKKPSDKNKCAKLQFTRELEIHVQQQERGSQEWNYRWIPSGQKPVQQIIIKKKSQHRSSLELKFRSSALANNI